LVAATLRHLLLVLQLADHYLEVISAIRNVVDQFLTLGAQQQPASGTTGGIFGSTTPQNTQSTIGGLFGKLLNEFPIVLKFLGNTTAASQPSTGGMFGSTQPASGVASSFFGGSTAPAFGSSNTTAPAFGSTTGGSLFGGDFSY
jgi:hypothetical protein